MEGTGKYSQKSEGNHPVTKISETLERIRFFHYPENVWGVVGDMALDGGKCLGKHFPVTTIRVVNMLMDPVADDVHHFTTWSLDEQSHDATSGVALDIA